MNPTAPVLMVLLVVASVVAPVAAAENEPPLVDAGLDQRVPEGSVVLLDGGGAVDPDGEIVSYEWSIETPRGETIRPEEPTAIVTRFVPERVGRYRVTLVATDDDGATGEDTLYVDVAVSVGEGGGGPDAGNPGNRGGAPSINPPSDVLPAASGSDAVEVQNRPPVGQILGPDEVYAGETRRFVIQASDVDGRVVDYWWVKGAITGGDSLQFEPHRSGKSYTFDLEPGAVAEITAMVKDDDGARTRISKEVKVLNNPPTVRIEGRHTVSEGTVQKYHAVASDRDSSITSYSWAIDQGQASVYSAPDSINQISSGPVQAEYKWLRFSNIPKSDATTVLSVIVEDEHGGVAKASKKVIVAKQSFERAEKDTPEIRSLDGHKTGISSRSVFGGSPMNNPGQITFSALAADKDSNTLTFTWKFGQRGHAKTVEYASPEAESTVTFLFRPVDGLPESIDVTVTVQDDTGRRDSLTRTLKLKRSHTRQKSGGSIQIRGGPGPYDDLVKGIVTIVNAQREDPSKVTLHFGDGTSRQFSGEASNSGERVSFDFRHKYSTSGKYTLFLFDSNWEGSSYGHETIDVLIDSYSEWHYQTPKQTHITTVSAKSPGENWSRVSVVSTDKELIDTERIETPIRQNGEAYRPSSKWVFIGTKSRSKTIVESITSAEKPGSDWELVTTSVGTTRILAHWSTITIEEKKLAQENWKFLERVPKTTTTTIRKAAAIRPPGSGWVRSHMTDDYEKVGYEFEWYSSRLYANSDWEYIRSKRYVTGYETVRECVEYVRFRTRVSCVDWVTHQTPEWGTRHLYRKPNFKPVYQWKRTIKTTEYDYKFRNPIYKEVPLNRYEKQELRQIQLAIWEKQVYAEIPIYKWETYRTNFVNITSRTPPTSQDAKKVQKHVHECESTPKSKNTNVCGEESP